MSDKENSRDRKFAPPNYIELPPYNYDPAWITDHFSLDSLRKTKWREQNPGKAITHIRERRAAKGETLRAYDRKWRKDNPEKEQARRDAHYFRPFVAIDSEGRNYPGKDDILHDEASGTVRYERHDTYLWGAAADDGQEPIWLTSMGYDATDKKPLTIYEILDWLLALPKIFGKASFVSFSFGYDASQIFKNLPFKIVWQICKRETFAKSQKDRKSIGSSPVYWGEYAFSYVKGKWLEIYHLRDRENPSVQTLGENGKRLSKYDRSIKIYDTFGFFQQGFSGVVKGMVEAGRAKPDEAEYIAKMKKLRDDPEIWAAQDIEAIKEYTSIELRLLAREMSVLRQAFIDLDGTRLQSWHGPGAAASAFLRGRKINKKYYPDDIRSDALMPWQEAAHHAYHAGHIEMMKHGYIENTVLHVLDIASAYPAATVELPSMKDGHWTKQGYIAIRSLPELRATIGGASMLSMYKIAFRFPEYEKFRENVAQAVFIPFYPLPYRRRSGGIIYPAYGHGWYMRDDVLAMIAWLERFVPDYPERPRKEQKETAVMIEEAWLFHAASDEKPFTIVRDFYSERKRIKRENPFDPREKSIKLDINSIYGQFARYVGEAGKVPKTANPWYAAAITAATRRRLMEAGLLDPHSIVFFATDGIVSTSELTGLPRVRKGSEDVALGDWEYCEADGGIFIQAGVYAYGKVKNGKDGKRSIIPVSKLRGATAKNYTNAEDGAGAWLIRETLARWRAPYSTAGSNLTLSAPYKKYITAGAALASPDRWKLAGRWTPKAGDPQAAYRAINISDPGGKRVLLNYDPDLESTSECPANRCSSLVRTVPVINNDDELSRPRTPNWVVDNDGEIIDLGEQAEIAAGFD